MKFLPPGYNTKDLESKQSNKWRWAWLSECDTNLLKEYVEGILLKQVHE